jgi:hypothetical protein
MAFPRDMFLGEGIFSFGAALTTSALTDFGAVRGGGVFNVTRTYRKRAADGDFGFVKGRIAIDEEVATLTIRQLDVLSTSISSFYPAMTATSTTNLLTLTGGVEVASGDYKKVRFTGKTDGGNAVQITLDNALNMAPLNWELLDKNEVVSELVFTACSLEATTTVPQWTVTIATT